MLLKRWPVIVFLGVLLNILVSGNKAAQAYILPPEQIIEYVSKQTAKVYNLHLVAWAESPDPELPKTMMRREMVIYAARPDFLRQEMVGEAGSDITLVSSGRRLSVTDGHLLAEPLRHEDIFAILLHANSPQTLETLLVSEQVDVSQAHISRFDKRIAYVIGGPPGEAKSPQFWCDKDTFLPLRLIGRRVYQNVADLVDIRFLSYQKVGESIWLPWVIEFYRQDTLFLRLTVQKAYFNERLPDSLFDFEALVAKYPPPPPPSMEPAEKPPEDLERMRRYLEKKYE
jgi:outer membrane lipoprotein-sorting protein